MDHGFDIGDANDLLLSLREHETTMGAAACNGETSPVQFDPMI